MSKQAFVCDGCRNTFYAYPSQRSLDKKFCNKKCESEWKKRYYSDPTKRQECNTWQGRKHSAKTKRKMSLSMKGIKKRPLTMEEKLVQHRLWDASKRAWQRRMMESKGLWVPLDQRTAWEVYEIQSNWVKPMFDLLSVAERNVVHKVGVFDVRTNKNGMVRHHKYSRTEGFKNGVFPVILRHPCNCGVLRNYENRNHNRNDLTLEQLFCAILDYTESWLEQDSCIDHILRYRRGERWSKDSYIPVVGAGGETL